VVEEKIYVFCFFALSLFRGLGSRIVGMVPAEAEGDILFFSSWLTCINTQDYHRTYN